MNEIWWLRIFFLVFALQGIEYFLLSKKTEQVWASNELASDYLTGSRFMKFIFAPSFYKVMCLLRATGFFGIFFPFFPFALVIFFTQIYFALRFRGSFNGGSDYLGLIISLCVTLILIFPEEPLIVRGTMYYLALQLTFSYFFAGQIKIKEKMWREGEALPAFFRQTIFDKNVFIDLITQKKKIMFLLSWVVMFWELTFPLVWLGPTWCLIYSGIGLLFHFGNFWIFGLNRFLLLWPLLYPIIYLAVSRIH
jgi:hypothetical protein